MHGESGGDCGRGFCLASPPNPGIAPPRPRAGSRGWRVPSCCQGQPDAPRGAAQRSRAPACQVSAGEPGVAPAQPRCPECQQRPPGQQSAPRAASPPPPASPAAEAWGPPHTLWESEGHLAFLCPQLLPPFRGPERAAGAAGGSQPGGWGRRDAGGGVWGPKELAWKGCPGGTLVHLAPLAKAGLFLDKLLCTTQKLPSGRTQQKV